MNDVAPALLKKIQIEFQNRYNANSHLKALAKNTKDYSQANEYAIGVGELLSDCLKNNLTADVLPDGKMYYNIASRILTPTLGENYALVSAVCEQAQSNINAQNGVGLKPVVPAINQSRVDGFVDRISSQPFEEVQWLVGEPVVNFTQNVVNEFIQENASASYKSGLAPKLRRILAPEERKERKIGKYRSFYYIPCKWCEALAGEYDYGDQPEDFFRTHENCRCRIEYIENGRVKDVRKQKWIDDPAETTDRVKTSKRIEKKQQAKSDLLKLQRESIWENAKNIEEAYNYAEKELGLYFTEKPKSMSLDCMNMINKEVKRYFDFFGNLHEKDVLNGFRIVSGKKRYAAAYSPAFGEVLLVKSSLSKKGFAEMLEDAQINHDLGFWSTPYREQVIRHELGHAIEKMVKNNTDIQEQLTQLRSDILKVIGLDRWDLEKYTKEQMKQAGQYLSYYGLASNGEMIAESIAEIMGGNPRATAQRVYEIIKGGLK